MKAINKRNGKELADKLHIAKTLSSRLKGLLGKNSMVAGEALLLRPCKSIHTFGMRFPIDAVFLNKKNIVVGMSKNLLPNRITKLHFSADAVLELPSGVLNSCNLENGDQIIIS